MSITLSQLLFYPIKSCKGTPLQRATITPRGIENDRLLMLVDEAGNFLTQREMSKLALIAPALNGRELTVTAPGMSELRLEVSGHGPRHKVMVWNDTCEAVDQGREASDWMSEFLGQPTRLVRIADEHVRRVDPRFARTADDQTSFSDGYPFLLANEASLDDLNTRLASQGSPALPMNRFRPNLVVQGCEPFAEDTWRDIEVGRARFGVVKPCARCVVTTTDQNTGQRGKEPLRIMSAFRQRDDGKVLFAQNLVFVRGGEVGVGDEVRVLA